VLGITSIDAAAVRRRLGDRFPRRSVAVFASLTAMFLAIAWGRGIAARTFAGEFGWPEGDLAIAHVVQALDLGLQVPFAIATAALLFARRDAGYVIGSMFLVNAIAMGAALTAMVGVASSVAEAAPFAIIPSIALVLSALACRSPSTTTATTERSAA
jgi:hypothetical protein